MLEIAVGLVEGGGVHGEDSPVYLFSGQLVCFVS